MTDSNFSTEINDSAITGIDAQLALQLSTMNLGFPSSTPLEDEPYRKAKEDFIASKLNPSDVKEKQQLKNKLTLTYSEKKANREKQGVFSRESKLKAYTKELESQFDEKARLQNSEASIMNDYAKARFIEKPIPLHHSLSWGIGYFKSAEQSMADEKAFNAERRKRFILTNREPVLLEVLRSAIKTDLASNEDEKRALEKEDKAQIILSPLCQKRIDERKQEMTKIGTDRQNTRYYAPVATPPNKHITNDAPELASTVAARQRFSEVMIKKARSVPEPTQEETQIFAQLDQKRKELTFSNPARSDAASTANRHVTEGRVLDGRSKKFKPLV